MPALDKEQLIRYKRNILLNGVGKLGQQKLLNSKVLIVGAGGLGSPAAYYLAAAGIGRIGIVDADTVDLSNLQRQIIHNFRDLGKPKAVSAAEKLRVLNSDVQVDIYNKMLTKNNAEEIISSYQVVIDATDNFAARQLINEVCYRLKKPFIYGGVLAMQGQVMTIVPDQGPCFSCIFRKEPPENAPTTSTVGILGAVAGVIGSVQVSETVKILLQMGSPLVGRMFTIDLAEMLTDLIEVSRDNSCPVCGSI